jgi:hypothetical protein
LLHSAQLHCVSRWRRLVVSFPSSDFAACRDVVIGFLIEIDFTRRLAVADVASPMQPHPASDIKTQPASIKDKVIAIRWLFPAPSIFSPHDCPLNCSGIKISFFQFMHYEHVWLHNSGTFHLRSGKGTFSALRLRTRSGSCGRVVSAEQV